MRQANGDGSISRRSDGRWEARYYVPQGTGRARKYIYARTAAECRSRLRQALRDRDSGVVPVPARETVASFLESWLQGHETSLRPRTAVEYRHAVTTYLAPAFARVPLGQLTPQRVQALYRELSDGGLSPKTIVNVHCVLHKALDQALRWRLVSANVADLVDPPRVPRHEMQALSAAHARRVLAMASGSRWEALWCLALSTGLRQGELLALRWPQVDLDRSTLAVVGTLEQGTDTVAEPKTQRSRRQVQLGAATAEALRRHRQSSSSISFVFHREDGRPLSASIVSKEWTRLRAQAGVPAVRFHDLRHTAATLMLSGGVHPKVASEMLGHSTVAITLDLYSHVTPTMQREAAQLVDELLSR